MTVKRIPSLNECLSLMANIDQITQAALIYELVYTMLETGSIFLVPVDTDTHGIE